MSRISPGPKQVRLPVIQSEGLRIAQISGRTPFQGAQLVPVESWHTLAGFAPHVLVGCISDLRRLVERLDLKTVEMTGPSRAVFVVTMAGDKPLTDVFRVVLWQRFGVPVYELYVDSDCRLLAHECELQDGWHIEPGV